MKCFYSSSYKFYKPNLKKELKFFLISDIHFSPKVKTATLNAIIKQAKLSAPNYILIAGDLIDSLGSIDGDSDLARLSAWLERLGQIAPTFIGLGNHDFYRANPEHRSIFSKKRHWYPEEPIRLINAIREIDNVTVLDNEAYEDKYVYIYGFTQSVEYFQFDKENQSTTLFHPGGEDKNILLHDLHKLDGKYIQNLPKHKAKIFLAHSPVFLSDAEISSYIYEYDYVVSGHMHNGVVPPILADFWRSDRGIMAPGKLFFARHSRTHVTDPEDRAIICGAVSTIQDSSKPLTFLNGAFPVNIATLELTHDERRKRKPDVKHKYISF